MICFEKNPLNNTFIKLLSEPSIHVGNSYDLYTLSKGLTKYFYYSIFFFFFLLAGSFKSYIS